MFMSTSIISLTLPTRRRIDSGDVRIKFTAATTDMSLLLEKSTSIRHTFVQLAQKHEDTICILDREGRDIVLWIDGESVLEDVGDSLVQRGALRKRVRANRMQRPLDSAAFATAMRDPDYEVRAAAIQKYGADNYVSHELLEQALLHDSSPDIRSNAAEALGKFDHDWGRSALRRALHDADAKVRRAACAALGRLDMWYDDGTLADLHPLLRDNDWRVQWAAAAAFAKHARAEQVPQLIEALGLEAAHISAAEALGRLRSIEAVDALCATFEMKMKEGYLTAKTIAEALTVIGDRRAVPSLMRIVEGGDCHARPAAATALGVLGDPRALVTLRRSLETHECCGHEVVTNSIRRIEASISTSAKSGSLSSAVVSDG
jgi:HEAT repeat protein